MNYEPFVLERTFMSPRNIVWAAFTQAEHLGRWFSPAGMKPGRNQMDFREGGIYHYELIPPLGDAFWGRWIFREIVNQELMVKHVSFSDEGGGITRHPMAPDWPLETLSKIRFASLNGGTQIRLESSAIGSDRIQLQTFEDARSSLLQGWTGTLDHLDIFLARVQHAWN